MGKFFCSWLRDALLLALVLVALVACGTMPVATTGLHVKTSGGFHFQLVPSPQTVLIIITDEDDCSLHQCT